ncbi:unnamed protein product [Ambrosiozyma monospora]|uniref:Unnamed protein product n=1 Tax=Ambrosiozyma monospora TaxID=43982 RepID=A0A9W6Z922_AMBMO|nr:unnamed protein product [Ambrosiozyma monospora]
MMDFSKGDEELDTEFDMDVNIDSPNADDDDDDDLYSIYDNHKKVDGGIKRADVPSKLQLEPSPLPLPKPIHGSELPGSPISPIIARAEREHSEKQLNEILNEKKQQPQLQQNASGSGYVPFDDIDSLHSYNADDETASPVHKPTSTVQATTSTSAKTTSSVSGVSPKINPYLPEFSPAMGTQFEDAPEEEGQTSRPISMSFKGLKGPTFNSTLKQSTKNAILGSLSHFTGSHTSLYLPPSESTDSVGNKLTAPPSIDTMSTSSIAEEDDFEDEDYTSFMERDYTDLHSHGTNNGYGYDDYYSEVGSAGGRSRYESGVSSKHQLPAQTQQQLAEREVKKSRRLSLLPKLSSSRSSVVSSSGASTPRSGPSSPRSSTSNSDKPRRLKKRISKN